MAFYCDYIFPLLNDRAEPSVVSAARRWVVSKAVGEVLEIGFGTGKTLPFYPKEISSLTIVEPSEGMNRRVQKDLRKAPFPVSFRSLNAETLPFCSGSFDTVVSTKTLCSVSELDGVLGELHRVLKHSGQLLFLEHVESADANIARWQNWLTPLQKRIGCGCHLNRDIASAINANGFTFKSLSRLEGGPEHPGTRFMPVVAGVACRD